jgi:hypothetical protein
MRAARPKTPIARSPGGARPVIKQFIAAIGAC